MELNDGGGYGEAVHGNWEEQEGAGQEKVGGHGDWGKDALIGYTLYTGML